MTVIEPVIDVDHSVNKVGCSTIDFTEQTEMTESFSFQSSQGPVERIKIWKHATIDLSHRLSDVRFARLQKTTMDCRPHR